MRPPELTAVDGLHRREPQVPRWAVALIAVTGVVAVVTGVIATRGAGDIEDRVGTVTVERDAAAGQATDLARKVVAACAAGGGTTAELERVGACQQAQQVKVQPIPGPQGVPGPQGLPGPLPDPEQLRAVVAAFMAENPPSPGRGPTPAEVAEAVTDYLTDHPPEPGRPPTQEQVANAVATYFATNPTPAGRDGEPGRPPTAEEIRAVVAAELAANPPAQGERGEPGPTCVEGTSLRTVQYADDQYGLGCVLDDQPPPQSRPTEDPDPPTIRPTTTPTPDPEDSTAPTTSAAPETE